MCSSDLGIFAINREVDEYIAEKINEFFVEIVIAPYFSKEEARISRGAVRTVRATDQEDSLKRWILI